MRPGIFGQELTQLRTRANLSNRDLAALADVPHSLIAGLQSGSRRIGEYQAKKIGIALGLSGEKLDRFILTAVDTCTEKILVSAREYPASLLNWLPVHLRSLGILPQQLTGIECDDKSTLRLVLTDGSIASIEATVAYA